MESYKGMADSCSFRHSRARGRRRSPRGQCGADSGCRAVPKRRGRGIAPRVLNSRRRRGACAFPRGTEGTYRCPDPLLSTLGAGMTQKGRPPPPPSAGGVREPRREPRRPPLGTQHEPSASVQAFWARSASSLLYPRNWTPAILTPGCGQTQPPAPTEPPRCHRADAWSHGLKVPRGLPGATSLHAAAWHRGDAGIGLNEQRQQDGERSQEGGTISQYSEPPPAREELDNAAIVMRL